MIIYSMGSLSFPLDQDTVRRVVKTFDSCSSNLFRPSVYRIESSLFSAAFEADRQGWRKGSSRSDRHWSSTSPDYSAVHMILERCGDHVNIFAGYSYHRLKPTLEGADNMQSRTGRGLSG